MASAASQPIPLITGTTGEFAALRAALRSASYDDASVCRRTGFRSIFEFQTQADGRRAGTELNDALDALIQLLMDGEALAEARLRALLPPELMGGLEALGIVARTEDDPQRLYATVLLYPIGPLYIVADRFHAIGGGPMAEDLVFQAISPGTRLFLSGIPEAPCEALLDLGTGTGIAALLSAGRAQHAWACDIAERSVRFAEFNCRLNGAENVTCAQGDLYEPVAGMTFDRIVAHPPYLPAGPRNLIFRDGGNDGEQILRRMVEGLPRYLRPGGRCYAFAMGTDRTGDTFEQRIRRWLGEREAEFDVLLVASEYRQRRADLLWLREVGLTEDFDPRLQVTAASVGAIVIERFAGERRPVTARTLRASRAGSDAIEWFVAWHKRAAAPGFDAFLLEAKPRMAARFRLRVEHAPVEGALAPAGFELRSDYPFSVATPCPQWVAQIVGACDGRHTVREIFAAMKEQRVIGPESTIERFGRDMRELIGRGFLELDECPLPRMGEG